LQKPRRSCILSSSNIPKNKKACLSWRDYIRPLKITAPIESDSEISFRDMVNRKIECLTEVHSEVVGIKYGVHRIGYSIWYSAIILYR
jgi:hypothetical protein